VVSDTAHPPVPFDTELRAALALFKIDVEFEPLTPDTLAGYRRRLTEDRRSIERLTGDDIVFEERTIPGPSGDLEVLIVHRRTVDPGAPGVLALHGGGFVLGSRFGDSDNLVMIARAFGAVCVSVEYRLAPEHPHPAGLEDCYAALVWMSQHAAELGIDPDRIIVRGGSAGGGLAAGVALLTRDRGGPALAGQMLICPMIDDRDATVSVRQYDGLGIWDRSFNRTGWTALLGDAAGGPDVSPYAAPARATDFAGLPSAFIEVGAAEVFRDEDTAYASALWAAGVPCELHVWGGAFHGFSSVHPHAPVSRAALAVRRSWLERIFRV